MLKLTKMSVAQRVRVGIICLVCVMLLGGMVVYHVSHAPATTVRNLYTAVLVNHQVVSGAFCDDGNTDMSQVTVGIPENGLHYDLSHVTFTTMDEQFMKTAHVKIGGYVTINGITHPVGRYAPENLLLLVKANWLEWCIDSGYINFDLI